MKIIDIQQNTSQWSDLRRNKIGASDVGVLMTGTEKEIDNLFREKFGEEKFVTEAMRRGSDLEKHALAFYEQNYGIKFERPVGVHDKYDWLMASFDGFNFEKNISIEIKCPTIFPEGEIEDWKWYKRYYWQIQAQLAVGGHDISIFMIYSPEKSIETVIKRNEEDIQTLLKQCEWFYSYMKLGISPYLIAKRDDVWDKAAEELALAKERAKEADLVVQEKEKILKSLSLSESSEGSTYRYIRSEMPGRISYSKIPELKSVNLDLYRGKSFETWKLSKI